MAKKTTKSAAIDPADKEPWLLRMEQIPESPQMVLHWEEVTGMTLGGLREAVEAQSGYVHASRVEQCARAILMVCATAIDGETTLYKACRELNFSYPQFLGWRRRMPVVDQAIEVIEQVLNARVDHEIYERAVEGWDEDVWWQGAPVGTKRVRDHGLLRFYAESNDAKYTPKQKIEKRVTGSGENGAVVIDASLLRGLSDEELEFLEKMVAKKATEES